MSAATTTYEPASRTTTGHRLLRPLIAGAAAFDAALGVFCLVDAGRIGDWLSMSDGAIRAIGVVLLVAAVVGVETLLMPRLGTRWIVGANLLFAVWCLAAIAVDDPNTAGAVVLALAAASSAGTAALEHRLSRP